MRYLIDEWTAWRQTPAIRLLHVGTLTAYALAALCVLVSSCSGRGPCSVELHADGWVRTSPIGELSNERNERAAWFENADGDVLVCHSLQGGRICDGIYELFVRLPDGSLSAYEIVCM